MDDRFLKAISIAGLFHDIGKFAERAFAVEGGDPDMIRQEYKYAHAFNTEQAMKELFPEEILCRRLNNKIGIQECNILDESCQGRHLQQQKPSQQTCRYHEINQR